MEVTKCLRFKEYKIAEAYGTKRRGYKRHVIELDHQPEDDRKDNQLTMIHLFSDFIRPDKLPMNLNEIVKFIGPNIAFVEDVTYFQDNISSDKIKNTWGVIMHEFGNCERIFYILHRPIRIKNFIKAHIDSGRYKKTQFATEANMILLELIKPGDVEMGYE